MSLAHSLTSSLLRRGIGTSASLSVMRGSAVVISVKQLVPRCCGSTSFGDRMVHNTPPPRSTAMAADGANHCYWWPMYPVLTPAPVTTALSKATTILPQINASRSVNDSRSAAAILIEDGGNVPNLLNDLGIWLSSTLKKRKTKMNKHKLQKRRKKARLKSK